VRFRRISTGQPIVTVQHARRELPLIVFIVLIVLIASKFGFIQLIIAILVEPREGLCIVK
jgi:uncharacterized membrane protein YkvI